MKRQMNLGEFIIAIKALPKTYTSGEETKPFHIEFAFGGLHPAGFDSYRGSYDQIALDFKEDRGPKPVLVTDLLKQATDSIGETFTGWKGGEYTMHEDTRLWVAHAGECPGTGIIGITEGDVWAHYIETAHFEF